MRDFVIPVIIAAGAAAHRKRREIAVAAALALVTCLTPTGIFMYTGKFPFTLTIEPQENIYNNAKALQFVMIDDNLPEDQPPAENKTPLKGRQNRISRDLNIDKSLPALGPATEKSSPVLSAQEGAHLPSAPAVEANSAPAKPQQQQPASQPSQPTQPTPPVAEAKPVENQKPAPEKPSTEEKAVKAPVIAKTAQDVPELTEADIPGTFFTTAAERKKAGEAFARPQTKRNDKEDKPAPEKEPVAKTVPQTTPQPPQPPQPQRPQQTPQQQQPAQIPVRRIGAENRRQGSKVGLTRQSSAMDVGARSMAVLRDRYGEYMEILLRRIQEAIIVQQQLSPLFFTQGMVIMTFSVNENGILNNVHFIESQPANLSNETAAARRVLDDVATGKPLPPPSRAMLEDPEFQKITINFLFQQF